MDPNRNKKPATRPHQSQPKKNAEQINQHKHVQQEQQKHSPTNSKFKTNNDANKDDEQKKAKMNAKNIEQNEKVKKRRTTIQLNKLPLPATKIIMKKTRGEMIPRVVHKNYRNQTPSVYKKLPRTITRRMRRDVKYEGREGKLNRRYRSSAAEEDEFDPTATDY